MILSINHNNYLNLKQNLSYKGIKVTQEYIRYDNYVKTPANDEFIKKNDNTNKKILLGTIFAAILVLAGVRLARKPIKTAIINHNLSKVENQFEIIEKDIPAAQKEFTKIFLNDELSATDTKEMLNRYKQLEIMRANNFLAKEEKVRKYLEAVFEEAIKNYGLENCNIKLKFENLDNRLSGEWRKKSREIVLNSGKIDNMEYMFGTIHHELRHAKQNQIIGHCADDNTWIKYIKKYNGIKTKKFNTFGLFGKEYDKTFLKETKKSISIQDGNIKNPQKYKELAEKLLEAEFEYEPYNIDFGKYWSNFKEIDARDAEEGISKLFGLNKRAHKIRRQRWDKYLKNNKK